MKPTRLANASKNAIVTRGADGSLTIAAWNLVDPDQKGTAKTIELVFRHVAADARATIQRVDEDHGNILREYEALGRPLDPTPAQVEQMNRATAISGPEETRLQSGRLVLRLAPNALVLVKVQP